MSVSVVAVNLPVPAVSFTAGGFGSSSSSSSLFSAPASLCSFHPPECNSSANVLTRLIDNDVLIILSATPRTDAP